jgi:hypothetical protein
MEERVTIMPDTFLQHVDDPTFEKVQAACLKRKVRVTVLVRNRATVTCRTEVKGNVASIDFDLITLGSNFSNEAQRRFLDKHGAYLKANIKQFRGVKPGIDSHFGGASIRFQVLQKDASEWFDDIYRTLLDPANFTALASPFDMFKKAAQPANTEKQKKPATSKQPLPDSPEIAALRAKLSELQRPGRPITPEKLKEIQRVLTTYERPNPITNYVKRTRGSTCQLCGYEGFRKRNGKLYCEVHHLFHLSENPPPACLGPEYLIVLCATCHRRMHYAEVGEPVREEEGWRVRVDSEETMFETAEE